MATLTETSEWTSGIYQLETTDPVEGGPNGIDNLQAKQLANRTLYLKEAVESLGDAATAHDSASDPHPQYTTTTEVNALIEARVGDYVIATNTGNAYVVALDPVITAYDAKTAFSFKASADNTGAATLDAGGGAKPLLRDNGTALKAGDLAAGAVVSVVYDTTTASFFITDMVLSQVASSIQKGAFNTALATGTADAITAAFTPAPTLLTAGLLFIVRAAAANTSTAPTFTPNDGVLAAKPIVKGTGSALAAGDIAGAGHWLELVYDTTLGAWVLQNPAKGISASQGSGAIAQVEFFALTAAPTGWLKANGAAISRTTYADLFTAIGTTFGAGNGSTTFNLPDLRGEFLRGWDDGRGVDSGRAFGSAQADDFKSHTHQDNTFGNYAPNAWWINSGSAYGNNFTTTTGSTGGAETRPRNVALLACIKY